MHDAVDSQSNHDPFYYTTLGRARFPTFRRLPVPGEHYFLAFFFLEAPDGVADGDSVSTRTASSSLTTLACAFSDSLSSSLMNSVLMLALRFSHHSLSRSVCASISSSRSRRTLLAAISLADWKMIWPHPGTRAFAWVC